MKNRIAFLLGDGFEDSEFQMPFDRLKGAGFDIDVIGAKKGETVTGLKKRTPVKVTTSIGEARFDDYIALVIPGGQSPDHLRVDERFPEFVRAFDRTGRPLAAVCHGPQLLMAANLVKGRTLTAWRTVQADLKLIDGVTVKDEPVVVDDNWITSRKPADLDLFCEKLLEEIREFLWRNGMEREPRAAEETRSGQLGAAASDNLIDPWTPGWTEVPDTGNGIPDRGETEDHIPYIEH